MCSTNKLEGLPGLATVSSAAANVSGNPSTASRAAQHKCTVPKKHSSSTWWANALTWNVKDTCKKGFDICSFLFLAKRKISKAVHAYEQHHKVSHCQVQLPAGDDKPIPACASLSNEALNMLSYSCWFSKTLEAHSLWKSLQKHLASAVWRTPRVGEPCATIWQLMFHTPNHSIPL